MMDLLYLIACALFAFAAATDVSQCPDKSIAELKENVQLQTCKKPPCRLKKGSVQHITVHFTPEKDLADVSNKVTAEVLGVPLPFIGVDGTSVCNKLETENGEKASCPLVANTKYVYKDSFPVLQIYPSIETKVHWAIRNNDEDISCFEVKVRIV